MQERFGGLLAPTLRLGVTGLSRSGKTVFLASLVHNLVHGGRLPMFAPYAEGRLASARLAPQPDDEVPRFPYEEHVRSLVEDRVWPASTRRIAELRVTIDYASARFFNRRMGRGRLHLDLVDYPGEWLLDLPLMHMSFSEWCSEALREAARRPVDARPFREALGVVDAAAPAQEADAQSLAAAFTAYLRAARADPNALASLPPGRFLMPGDLEGSPALTFAPLSLEGSEPASGSLAAMMERRYEAYKTHVVRPFFRDHFARLDRQIVLVDVLAALNGGPAALDELRRALRGVLACFRTGRLSFLGSLVDRRIDKILFAATKADHIHHGDHDRLERVLEHLVAEARERAVFSGTTVDVAAMAAVRATREASVTRDGETWPTIVGTPMKGERINGRLFDGEAEIGLFPGDLPADPADVFDRERDEYGVTTMRFRPGRVERNNTGLALSLPHIRLDRVLQYLIGDRLA
ncbi:YcjX family GTP-binding protein [Acuticoccus mangrovi]|uniref:YcjX family protein n=1 Tax=Acuticoccus mangrovi TaxID=2796142 RepID=A0A934INL9_9HYPH|nr:YcjX family protein [Acuticoccus mangrovi]MBJ3778231.1 YcjX family protein [Acuticoccus mangrovi]